MNLFRMVSIVYVRGRAGGEASGPVGHAGANAHAHAAPHEATLTLQSFPAFEADPVASDRGVATHAGACGLCSTAADLSVYLAQDFTTAGNACETKGLANATNGQACYKSLGAHAGVRQDLELRRHLQRLYVP